MSVKLLKILDTEKIQRQNEKSESPHFSERSTERRKKRVNFTHKNMPLHSGGFFVMKISQILQSAQKSSYRTEMEIYLAYLLGKSRLDLVRDGDEVVPVEKMGEIQKAWLKILDGYPVAYLTGVKEFYGIPLFVDENVLVPRPETELLVDYVCELAGEGARILEVGTGSGAIAIALKKTHPAFQVWATDVSRQTLSVAKKNIEKYGLDIELIESDLLQNVKNDFDILVANLPYIGEVRHNFIAENVQKHEPHVALFGGSDGLRLYERMFLEAKGRFKYILGEIGFSQGEDIEDLCTKIFPEAKFELKQDYSGLDRHFILKF